jgi:hypothetical protein
LTIHFVKICVYAEQKGKGKTETKWFLLKAVYGLGVQTNLCIMGWRLAEVCGLTKKNSVSYKPERRFIQKKWSTLRHGGMNLRRIPGYGIRNINVLQAIKLFLLRHEERKRRRAYRE